jgi:hypothetical protein
MVGFRRIDSIDCARGELMGGPAPAPTGGEFVTVPVQKQTERYATTVKLVACLSSTDNSFTTDTTLSYIAPTHAVQAKQVAATPDLKVCVDAVQVYALKVFDIIWIANHGVSVTA